MMYALDDLLKKMGAPETKEKGQIRWHYFDKKNEEIGGFAEVRLLDNGATLIAEVKHLRPKAAQDDISAGSEIAGVYSESLYLHARRAAGLGATARYEVTKIAFDGEEYAHPQKSVIELGLSLFHARALDISILMVEQSFNKDDIMQPVTAEEASFKGVPVRLKEQFGKESWGVVVPFRPRIANSNSHPAL